VCQLDEATGLRYLDKHCLDISVKVCVSDISTEISRVGREKISTIWMSLIQSQMLSLPPSEEERILPESAFELEMQH
jgi:hypothetical protein